MCGNYPRSSVVSGDKIFYLKDANNCELEERISVTQPESLQLSFENRINTVCNSSDGSIEAVVSGGNGGYKYSWQSLNDSNIINTSKKLINAASGLYRVNVTDSKNCNVSDNTFISNVGGAVFELAEIRPVTCFGYNDGSASIAIQNVIEPYRVRWSHGQEAEYASQLIAGKYFVTVEDRYGCKVIRQVTVPSPEPIQSEFIKIQPLCFGERNGSLNAIVSGGTAPYTYKWDNSENITKQIDELPAGSYALNIEDIKGCKSRIETKLNEPTALQIEGFVEQPTCLGRCDGKISVAGSGGNGIYNFRWKNGITNPQLANSCPGEYTITLTDRNDCSVDKNFNVPAGEPLAIDLGGNATVCVGQSKVLDPGSDWGSVNWTSSFGFSSVESKILIKDPGTYFFKGVDNNDCIVLDTFKLETSLDILKAEFLMEPNAVVGDTLVAIDISWPLPEKIEWSYPSSFKPLSSSHHGVLYAQLSEPGTFSVGMNSFLAECRELREKTITVLSTETEGVNSGRLGFEELIQEFKLSPNPNHGRFSLRIILSEEEEIRVRIIQYPTGIVLSESVWPDFKDSNIEFALEDIPQGLYTALLTVKNEKRFIRFFKK